MTIPALPWWNTTAQAEFNTPGWMSDTARAAGISGSFWNSDLAGKSNYQPPIALVASISVPTHSGSGPLETPGYLNGKYGLSAAAPVSAKWVSTQTAGYPYTASVDLGLRGANVTDAQISAWGLAPRQYVKLGVAGRPYKTAPIMLMSGSFDYNVSLGYYIGLASNPFANFVVVDSFKDGPSGRGWWVRGYQLPTPGTDEIITPAWWTDRGGDTITFRMLFGGTIIVTCTGGGYVNQGDPVLTGFSVKISGYEVNGSQATVLNSGYDINCVWFVTDKDLGSALTTINSDGKTITWTKYTNANRPNIGSGDTNSNVDNVTRFGYKSTSTSGYDYINATSRWFAGQDGWNLSNNPT